MAGEDRLASKPVPEPLASQRIAVLTNVPNHYRVPLWNQLSRRLAEVGASLRVLFTGGESARVRHWVRHDTIEFDHRFLRTGPMDVSLDLERRLAEFAPSVVLAGGFGPASTGRALRYARARGIPFGIWSGDTQRQASARGRLRRLERRWILRRADFALAYGSLARDYLRSLAPELPVVIGVNSTPIPGELAPRSTNSPCEFLAVGQAISRKGLDVVIEAFRSLEPGLPCRLTVAGDGPELAGLQARASGDPRIEFLGAVQSDRILGLYTEADAFLFPSRSDVFGLVLVEAMGSGLPTITASAPASVVDLARDRENCLVIDGHEPADWAAAIRELVEDADLRRRLGESARATVLGSWTIDHSVAAWLEALALPLGGLTPRAGEER